MKSLKSITIRTFGALLVLFVAFSFSGCSKVPAGNVGVKFHLLGGDKGVDSEELSPGRYYIGWNEELYLFPTFTQNYVWTKNPTEGSEDDESITFQTKEGLSINADVGITYYVNPEKVTILFEKYKKGIEEITDIYLRNMVRDAFVNKASQIEVEYAYGVGKAKLLDDVETYVRNQVSEIGIVVEKIYLIGDMRLPDKVISALNDKIAAKQRAEQRENELREAEAEGKKRIALAEAERIELENKAKAITPNLLQYESIKKWDGKLPTYTGGGAIPFINMK